jgi:hypothetical protein
MDEESTKPLPLEYQPPMPRPPLWDRLTIRRLTPQALAWRVLVYPILFGTVILLLLPPNTSRSHPPTTMDCGHNIHQLLSLAYDYASKNNGTLPPTLQAMQPPSSTLSPSQFSRLLICPVNSAPYIYVGRGMRLSSPAPGTILIYEAPGNHKDLRSRKSAMVVGYADGSVRLIETPQADNIVAELQSGHNPPRPEKIR